MFEILILVILISIAFGVSLQSAFWGLVVFAVGAFLLFIVAGITGLGVSIIIEKAKQANTQKAKQARKARVKQKVNDAIEGILLFLLLILPFPLGVLLAVLTGGNIIFAALPFCAELFFFYKYAQKLLDKKQRGV